MTKHTPSGKSRSTNGNTTGRKASDAARAEIAANWQAQEEAPAPVCWACGKQFFALISVAGPSGDKIHPGCYTLASDKHRAELQRKAIADTPPVGMYISKRPPQLTSYDWEVKGEDEDNGPAVQHHDML